MPLFTVFAIYASNLQRFADTVKAANAVDAEQIIRRTVREPLYIAATVEGDLTPADNKTYGSD